MTFLLIIGVAFAGVSIALALRALSATRLTNRLALAQIVAYGFGGRATPADPARATLGDVAAAFARRVGAGLERRLGAERARRLRLLLNSAGYYRTSVAGYLGYRALAVAGAPVAILLLAAAAGGVSVRLLFALVALAGLGWVLPPFLVKRRAAARTASVDYEVPELVDLLVTMVEAGIGFAASLQLSASRVRGALGEELRLTLREQNMGLTMDEALENLLARTSKSVSMRAFVQAIVQGETLGVSIGKILRDLAVEMRKRRRQMAEERAQKAPVKLLFPLIGLILPAMLIIVLGPAVYAFLHSVG